MEGQGARMFIEIVERLMERWGYGRTEGRIYAVLLLSAGALTIAELAKQTNLSRSSVSVALSKLVRDYLVTYRREGKTKYFSAVPAFLEKFLQQPKEILERDVKPMQEIVAALRENADEEKRRRYDALLEDLNTLECVLRKVIELEEKESACLKERAA